MTKKNLGKSSIQVAPFVLGGNVFGWTIDPATSFRILDAFTDHGFNFVDTADIYSTWIPGHIGGESESIIGNWIARTGKRDKVVLATKVGLDMGEGKKGLASKYINLAVEDSLRRLQTDYIDLYQAHTDDIETPLEETLETFDRLIKAGKVRLIGASNYKGARLAEALEKSRGSSFAEYATLQPNYNLHARQDYETDLAPVAGKYDLGIIPYFSLASGFLTGKYRTKEDTKGTSREGMLVDYFDERGNKILKALSEVAQETGAEQGPIALAWLLTRPQVIGPIASATSVNQLQSLLTAVDLRLSTEHIQKLTEASAC
jgi:aryl-alcohol dehydrogenase-like predicted oxidoreductase